MKISFSCSLDLPIEKIRKCMGDPEADTENEVLKKEQELQVTIPFLFQYANLYFESSYPFAVT